MVKPDFYQREFSRKTDGLDRIFALHQNALGIMDAACRQGCCACCTPNVTLTSLEARRVFRAVSPLPDLMARVRKAAHQPRFQPKTTFNHLADLWMRGQEGPEEDPMPRGGACPLLVDECCAIYENRPLACRCLVSERRCTPADPALMPPFVLTVNQVFMQFVEHLDAGGFSGNLTDMLLHLSGRNPGLARQFAPNRPISVLMVPPEYQGQMAPIVKGLMEIPVFQR